MFNCGFMRVVFWTIGNSGPKVSNSCLKTQENAEECHLCWSTSLSNKKLQNYKTKYTLTGKWIHCLFLPSQVFANKWLCHRTFVASIRKCWCKKPNSKDICGWAYQRPTSHPCIPIPILLHWWVAAQKRRSRSTAECQEYQDVPLHPVTFCSVQSSKAFWMFWALIVQQPRTRTHDSSLMTAHLNKRCISCDMCTVNTS